MNYNKNMKLEIFRVDDENPILLDTFLLDDIATQFDYELAQQAKDAEKAKKKAAKKSNSTDEEAAPEPETEEEEVKIVNPKVKISIEFSRSGYMLVTKATVGTSESRRSILNVKHVRKDTQLSEEGLRAAKSRMKWYAKRDDDKIKTDFAKNEFESSIYTMRDWLREDENMPYVGEAIRDAYIEQLTEWEDWLYDEGANQNYSTYEKMHKNMTKDLDSYKARQVAHEGLEVFKTSTEVQLTKYKSALKAAQEHEDFGSTDEEVKDVEDKISEVETWFAEQVEAQTKLDKHEDPVIKPDEVSKKLKNVKKLLDKVKGKKKPKPKKEKKVEEEEEKKEEEKTEENTEEAPKEEAKTEDL